MSQIEELLLLRHPAGLTVGEVCDRLQPRRRFSGVRRLRGGTSDEELRSVEPVWVPHWLCRLRVELREPAAGPTLRTVYAITNAFTRTTWRLAEEPRLERRAPGDLGAEWVDPRLARADAIEAATAEVRWEAIRRGGKRLRGLRVACEDATLVFVPYWLGYLHGAGGQLRVRTVHGTEGTIEKHTVTIDILRALGQRMRSAARDANAAPGGPGPTE